MIVPLWIFKQFFCFFIDVLTVLFPNSRFWDQTQVVSLQVPGDNFPAGWCIENYIIWINASEQCKNWHQVLQHTCVRRNWHISIVHESLALSMVVAPVMFEVWFVLASWCLEKETLSDYSFLTVQKITLVSTQKAVSNNFYPNNYAELLMWVLCTLFWLPKRVL